LKTNKKALKSATNTDQSQGTAGAATQTQIKFSRLSGRKEREKMKYLNIISEKHRIATIKPEDLEYELAVNILKQTQQKERK